MHGNIIPQLQELALILRHMHQSGAVCEQTFGDYASVSEGRKCLSTKQNKLIFLYHNIRLLTETLEGSCCSYLLLKSAQCTLVKHLAKDGDEVYIDAKETAAEVNAGVAVDSTSKDS